MTGGVFGGVESSVRVFREPDDVWCGQFFAGNVVGWVRLERAARALRSATSAASRAGSGQSFSLARGAESELPARLALFLLQLLEQGLPLGIDIRLPDQRRAHSPLQRWIDVSKKTHSKRFVSRQE